MRRIVLWLVVISLSKNLAAGQNAITIGNAPRLNVSGQGTSVPAIGAAPRFGSAGGHIQTNFVPVDVTRNSIVPLAAVHNTAFQPRQASILDRLAQWLPFAAKTGAAFVVPEAVIIHDSLPHVTIK